MSETFSTAGAAGADSSSEDDAFLDYIESELTDEDLIDVTESWDGGLEITDAENADVVITRDEEEAQLISDRVRREQEELEEELEGERRKASEILDEAGKAGFHQADVPDGGSEDKAGLHADDADTAGLGAGDAPAAGFNSAAAAAASVGGGDSFKINSAALRSLAHPRPPIGTPNDRRKATKIVNRGLDVGLAKVVKDLAEDPDNSVIYYKLRWNNKATPRSKQIARLLRGRAQDIAGNDKAFKTFMKQVEKEHSLHYDAAERMAIRQQLGRLNVLPSLNDMKAYEADKAEAAKVKAKKGATPTVP